MACIVDNRKIICIHFAATVAVAVVIIVIVIILLSISFLYLVAFSWDLWTSVCVCVWVVCFGIYFHEWNFIVLKLWLSHMYTLARSLAHGSLIINNNNNILLSFRNFRCAHAQPNGIIILFIYTYQRQQQQRRRQKTKKNSMWIVILETIKRT